VIQSILANPALWPVVVPAIIGLFVAWLGLKGKLTEAHVGDQATFRKELLARLEQVEDDLAAERKTADEWRSNYFKKVEEIGELKVAHAQLTAAVLEQTNTINSLRRRPVEDGEPLDRRVPPARVQLPGEHPPSGEGS
jgi:hypothetical protein